MTIIIALICSSPSIAFYIFSSLRYPLDRRTRLSFSGVSLTCLTCSFIAIGLFLMAPSIANSYSAEKYLIIFYLDRISYIMAFVVSIIGFTVVRFSVRYMDGDNRQLYFLKWLSITVTAVFWLIFSGSILLFLLSWLAVSACLHKLLVYFADRPKALNAARKKFIVSRIGDLAIISGCIILLKCFGTLVFRDMFFLAAQSGPTTNSWQFQIAMLLIALGAVSKSAQLFFHSWLPESLEVPTPVSALMHAGIINAGGFLIVRLSPLFAQASLASCILAVWGTLTAVFAMSAMVTQSSVKKRLAYSTIGQMGFMIMQCGLGLYALAMLHIVAHSFYKAYAFLRSGSAMQQASSQAFFPNKVQLSGWRIVAIVFLFTTASLITSNFFKISYLPLILVWASVILQAFISDTLQVSSKDRKYALLASFRLLSVMLISYLALAYIFSATLSGIVAGSWIDTRPDLLSNIAVISVSLLIASGFILQLLIVSSKTNKLIASLAIHLHNGLYLGSYFDRACNAVLPHSLQIKKLKGKI